MSNKGKKSNIKLLNHIFLLHAPEPQLLKYIHQQMPYLMKSAFASNAIPQYDVKTATAKANKLVGIMYRKTMSTPTAKTINNVYSNRATNIVFITSIWYPVEHP